MKKNRKKKEKKTPGMKKVRSNKLYRQWYSCRSDIDTATPAVYVVQAGEKTQRFYHNNMDYG